MVPEASQEAVPELRALRKCRYFCHQENILPDRGELSVRADSYASRRLWNEGVLYRRVTGPRIHFLSGRTGWRNTA